MDTAPNAAGIRLQDGEKIVVAFRRTGWDQIVWKILSFGVYVPWWRVGWYVVTDRRLISKRGILNKSEVSLPLNFAQDASVHRAWYGIARVDISTAGGHEGLSRLDSLRPTDARTISDTVMSLSKKMHDRTTDNGSALDVTQALLRLGELRDSGGLTDDEFAHQKAQLLAQH